MRVRPVRPDDFEAVREVHQRAVRAEGPRAYDADQVAAWADWSGVDELDTDDGHAVLADRDGEPAGFGRLAVDDGEVVAVYVHPDHAGEGVGTALLAHLEGYARGAGLAELRLWSSLNAVGFYERAGYERVGRDSHETTGGVDLATVECRKRL